MLGLARKPVERALKQREGDVFDPARTADDLRSLWALGYFSDIQLLTEKVSGGLRYRILVTERPSVRSALVSSGPGNLIGGGQVPGVRCRPWSLECSESEKSCSGSTWRLA